MQTEESVRIRKSDLESWKTIEGMDREQMPAPEEVKPMDAFQVPKCAEPVGSTGIPGIPDIPYPKRPCKYGKIVINHGMNWVCLSFRETVFFMENDDDKL